MTVIRKLKSGGDYCDSEGEAPYKICMNLSCPQYSGGECPLDTPKLKGATNEDADEDLKEIEDRQKVTAAESNVTRFSSRTRSRNSWLI